MGVAHPFRRQESRTPVACGDTRSGGRVGRSAAGGPQAVRRHSQVDAGGSARQHRDPEHPRAGLGARPTRESADRNRSVHWLYRRVRPGTCSAKVRRSHDASAQTNRRTCRRTARVGPRSAYQRESAGRSREAESTGLHSPGTSPRPPRTSLRPGQRRRSHRPTAPSRPRPPETATPPAGPTPRSRAKVSATVRQRPTIFRQPHEDSQEDQQSRSASRHRTRARAQFREQGHPRIWRPHRRRSGTNLRRQTQIGPDNTKAAGH